MCVDVHDVQMGPDSLLLLHQITEVATPTIDWECFLINNIEITNIIITKYVSDWVAIAVT